MAGTEYDLQENLEVQHKITEEFGIKINTDKSKVTAIGNQQVLIYI